MKDVKAKNSTTSYRKDKLIKIITFIILTRTFAMWECSGDEIYSIFILLAYLAIVTIVKDESGFGFNVRGQVCLFLLLL
jgi:hypothetical protein